MTGYRIAGIVGLLSSFGLAVMAASAAASGATVQAYGVGEVSTQTSLTAALGGLASLFAGGGGFWALVKSFAPKVIDAKTLSTLEPFIERLRPFMDERLKPLMDGGLQNVISGPQDVTLDVVKKLLGQSDPKTWVSEALLVVVMLRAKENDSEGTQMALELFNHISGNSNAKPSSK